MDAEFHESLVIRARRQRSGFDKRERDTTGGLWKTEGDWRKKHKAKATGGGLLQRLRPPRPRPRPHRAPPRGK
jgi:hypothetical protein